MHQHDTADYLRLPTLSPLPASILNQGRRPLCCCPGCHGTAFSVTPDQTLICRQCGKESHYSALLKPRSSFVVTTPRHRLIAAGPKGILAIRSDGTIHSQFLIPGCSTAEWNSIREVACGAVHFLGLREDGTALCVGKNQYNQCYVHHWQDVAAISASTFCSVALKKNGTLMAEGAYSSTLRSWENIRAVSVGDNRILGLKKDGTVVSTNKDDQVGQWRSIIAVSAGKDFAAGLQADGKAVVADTAHCDLSGLSRLQNLAAIEAGNNFLAGLKRDGTVTLAVARKAKTSAHLVSLYNEVRRWKEIIQIASGRDYLIGLKANGTILTAGTPMTTKAACTLWYDLRVPQPEDSSQ